MYIHICLYMSISTTCCAFLYWCVVIHIYIPCRRMIGGQVKGRVPQLRSAWTCGHWSREHTIKGICGVCQSAERDVAVNSYNTLIRSDDIWYPSQWSSGCQCWRWKKKNRRDIVDLSPRWRCLEIDGQFNLHSCGMWSTQGVSIIPCIIHSYHIL